YDATDTTFRAFMNGSYEGKVPDARPTIGDWNNHLSTLFPDVRLKKYIEMRGADGGPWRRICALPAFWVGLLYDDGILDQAWQLVRDWTEEERGALRAGVPRTALQTPFRAGQVLDVAKDVLALSKEGLRRRNRLSDGDLDEQVHLAPVEEGLAAGMSPADILLQRYGGSWDGDINQIFKDYAY
ncbi:MAG: glutamate-cysteine ligase family protein, partial [Roseibium sp.]